MLDEEVAVGIEHAAVGTFRPDDRTRAVRVTGDARLYRVVLAAASVALGVSPFLPWFSIHGDVYTLVVADRIPVVPAVVVLVASVGLACAWRRPRRAKVVGRWAGALALAANVVGFVVACLADPLVASTEPAYRVREQVSAWVTWGGCIAFGSSLVILVGACSSWKPLVSLVSEAEERHQGNRPRTGRTTRRGLAEEPLCDLPPLDHVIAAGVPPPPGMPR